MRRGDPGAPAFCFGLWGLQRDARKGETDDSCGIRLPPDGNARGGREAAQAPRRRGESALGRHEPPADAQGAPGFICAPRRYQAHSRPRLHQGKRGKSLHRRDDAASGARALRSDPDQVSDSRGRDSADRRSAGAQPRNHRRKRGERRSRQRPAGDHAGAGCHLRRAGVQGAQHTGESVLQRALLDRPRAERDPDRGPHCGAAAARRRGLRQAEAQNRRLRGSSRGRAGAPRKERRDRARRHRPHQCGAHAGRGARRGEVSRRQDAGRENHRGSGENGRGEELAERRPARLGRVQARNGAGSDDARTAQGGPARGRKLMAMHKISVTINGAAREAEVESRLLLVHLIREVFRMTGTHVGCDTSHCGACTVVLDGNPVKSCTVLAVQADDAKSCGMGHSMKRKEDPRFIRGQGRYIDDFVLPGMLYMDIVRSPHAHAKIKKIDTSKALKIPGVLAVIDGPTLAKYNLHWMPTISGDTQMVLPIDEVMYQAQEVCAVIATERYIAADGVDAVEVDYEPLPVMVDPHKSLAPGAAILRKDKKDKKDNLAFHWEAGDKGDAERALAASDVVISENVYLPRIHVASMETCGCIADFDTAQGKLTVYMTTQAPHAVRTVLALVAGHVGLSEEKIRVVSPDIGGGFGGKVPVYPGYVIAIAASVVIGKPVKWIEDRMENLQADSFARDYHMKVELGAKRDGTMTSLKIKTVADHGYANASANPSKFPAGLFSICTGSYDLQHAFCQVASAYTHKPP